MMHAVEKASILVVEDETLLRMLAVDLLEDAGYHVVEAATGDEGAVALDSGISFKGVLTDVELPGSLDGIALAHITHKKHQNAAILVVSGRVRPFDNDLPPGAIFLPKPYTNQAILRTLGKLIGNMGDEALDR